MERSWVLALWGSLPWLIGKFGILIYCKIIVMFPVILITVRNKNLLVILLRLITK